MSIYQISELGRGTVSSETEVFFNILGCSLVLMHLLGLEHLEVRKGGTLLNSGPAKNDMGCTFIGFR